VAASVSLAGAALVCMPTAATAAPTSNLVSSIIVAGLSRVDEKVVRDTIQTKIGHYFDPEAVAADVEKLRKNGEFATVDVQHELRDERVILTFRVKEQPRITAIRINGAKQVKVKKIEAEMKSRAGKALNPATLKNDMELIRKLYASKGYSRASVGYTLDETPEKNEAKVNVAIVEGSLCYVHDVVFSGNKHVSSTKLAWVMETKPRLLILFRKGVFDEYVLKEDVWRMTEEYMKAGYAEAKIEAKTVARPDGMDIHVTVVEGPPHEVGRIVIRRSKLAGFLATNLIYEIQQCYSGGVYSAQNVEKDAESLLNYCRSLGYADAVVNTKPIVSSRSTPQKRVVDVYFELTEKSVFDFGYVHIAGNKRTKDIVIRRELNIMPADRYNYYRLETSRQRLMNLDYFNKVDIRDVPSRSMPNAKDVYVNVDEKQTGRLGFGAGFSSVDQFVGFVEVSQSNFDWQNWQHWFVGGGQKVRLRAEIGNKRQDVVLSFTEPYFLYETLHGQKVSAGFDLFVRSHDFLAPDYRIFRMGGDVRAGTPIGFSWIPQFGKYIGSIRAELTAVGEVINVHVDDYLDYDDLVLRDDARLRTRVNPRNGKINPIYPAWAFAEKDKYLEDEEGTYVQFSPVLAFSRDTRDSLMMPTRGGESKWTIKTGLGSTIYGLTELKHDQFFKLFESWPRKTEYPFSGPHVLELRGAVGFATDNTPIFDRFFMGGPYEMRGFAYRMVGPKDVSGDNPLGGTTKMFGSLEYTFPIYNYSEKFNVRGALFMDMGNVWWKQRKYNRATHNLNGDWYAYEETHDNFGEINVSGGMGLRVNLPIGPIRLDYGIPFVKDSESKEWKPFDGFSFNAGASF